MKHDKQQALRQQTVERQWTSDAEKYVKPLCYLCCVLHIFFIGVDMSLPPGTFMPSPWTEIHGIVMLFMTLLHSIYCLGFAQSFAFFISNVAIEWAFEQTNISFGGYIFGPLHYADGLLGPKIGDVPVIVPVGIYFFCWPAYCLGNLIMHQRAVVLKEKHESYLKLAVRCVVYGMLHTAWSLSIDPACVNYGFYVYTDVEAAGGPIPQSDTYFGVPLSEFRGWTLLVFTQWFVYLAVVAPLLPSPLAEDKRKKRIDQLEFFDLTPVVLYGGFAVYLFYNPLNNALGVVSCWVLGLPVIMAAYQWLQSRHHFARCREADEKRQAREKTKMK